MLVTRRARLIEATIPFVRAFIAGQRARATQLVGMPLDEDWPGGDDAVAGLPIHLEAMERDPSELSWRIRLIATTAIVGSINLKGPPTVDGDVEIGWGLVPTARGRGLATEAALAVIDWIFTTPSVRRVIATIPPDHERSQNVALRLAMVPTLELKHGLPLWARTRLES